MRRCSGKNVVTHFLSQGIDWTGENSQIAPTERDDPVSQKKRANTNLLSTDSEFSSVDFIGMLQYSYWKKCFKWSEKNSEGSHREKLVVNVVYTISPSYSRRVTYICIRPDSNLRFQDQHPCLLPLLSPSLPYLS